MNVDMITAPIDHIVLDERGVAWIRDANTKVVEVVLDTIAWKMTPEAIQAQHPHLSMAQICAALAYYYDHRKEIDAQIQHDLAESDALRAAAGEPPITARLRAAGLLS
ncbi:MAG TPA: DUF433 domain-containing protein [Phycisphaerae bacterium]|jgi:uncharacterized protein (DUF433 family)